MSRRYYLAPIIGAGTMEDPYRAKVTAYHVNHSAVIPTGADGHPTSAWALCVVEAPDHTALIADSELDALPPLTIDENLSRLSVGARAVLLDKLTTLGIDITGIDQDTTFRTVLRRLGQHLDAKFHEDRMSVSP